MTPHSPQVANLAGFVESFFATLMAREKSPRCRHFFDEE
jgi:hypothetical protein